MAAGAAGSPKGRHSPERSVTYAGLHKPREVLPMDTNLILVLLGLGLACAGVGAMVSRPPARYVLLGLGAAVGVLVVLLALVAKLGG